SSIPGKTERAKRRLPSSNTSRTSPDRAATCSEKTARMSFVVRLEPADMHFLLENRRKTNCRSGSEGALDRYTKRNDRAPAVAGTVDGRNFHRERQTASDDAGLSQPARVGVLSRREQQAP